VVAKPLLVVHTIPFQQHIKLLLNKVGTIVTNEDMGDSEMGEDNICEEPSNHSGVIGGASKGFHPFGHTIYHDHDVLVPSGIWKRAHEIHTPNIKNFNFENVVKEHFIPP